jgi:Mn-dependent DtxR family transcriptional regulator
MTDEAIAAQRKDDRARAILAMRKGREYTSGDISSMCKIPQKRASIALLKLASMGLVTKCDVKGLNIFQLALPETTSSATLAQQEQSQ